MKAVVIGSFAFDGQLVGGQITKTRLFSDMVASVPNINECNTVDCSGKNKPYLLVNMIRHIIKSDFIFIGLGQNGMKSLGVFVLFFSFLLNKKIGYFVIGGWICNYLNNNRILKMTFKYFDFVFVETLSLKNKMYEMGFRNVHTIPNFRDAYGFVPPLRKNIAERRQCYSLIFYARVTKSKGVFDAIECVNFLNTQGLNVHLDIFGPLDGVFVDELDSDFIAYKGVLKNNSIKLYETLSNYDLLLFPTQHEGEGFPGTIVDAFISGVPVLASDWKYNSEVITDYKEGRLFDLTDPFSLNRIAEEVLRNHDGLELMRKESIDASEKYKIDKVLEDFCSIIF